MMSRFTLHRLLLFLMFIVPSGASAHVCVFLPGDAFFSSQWPALANEEDGDDVLGPWADSFGWDPQTQRLCLDYHRYSSWAMFCGQVGSETLWLDHFPSSAWDELGVVATWLIESSPRFGTVETHESIFNDEVTETPARIDIAVWVYDRRFNISKHPLGLKFNENWIKDQTNHGHSAVYDGFHDGEVATDWRFADAVSALPVAWTQRVLDEEGEGRLEAMRRDIDLKLKPQPEATPDQSALNGDAYRAGAMRDAGVVVPMCEWRECQIVMLRADDIPAVIERREGAEFFVVTDSVVHYKVQEGRLVELERRAIRNQPSPSR